MTNTNNIKVGDMIGFGQYHMGSLLSDGISKVTKINGHGHIHLEDGKVFDKYGMIRNSPYSRLYIIDVEEINQYKAERLKANLRFEKITKIQKLTENLKWDASEALKSELIALIETL